MMNIIELEKYLNELQCELSQTDPNDSLDKVYRYALKSQIAAIKNVLRVNP